MAGFKVIKTPFSKIVRQQMKAAKEANKTTARLLPILEKLGCSVMFLHGDIAIDCPQSSLKKLLKALKK